MLNTCISRPTTVHQQFQPGERMHGRNTYRLLLCHRHLSCLYRHLFPLSQDGVRTLQSITCASNVIGRGPFIITATIRSTQEHQRPYPASVIGVSDPRTTVTRTNGLKNEHSFGAKRVMQESASELKLLLTKSHCIGIEGLSQSTLKFPQLLSRARSLTRPGIVDTSQRPELSMSPKKTARQTKLDRRTKNPKKDRRPHHAR